MVPTPPELDNKGGSLLELDSKGGTDTESEPSSDQNPTPLKLLKLKAEPKPKLLKLKLPKPLKLADYDLASIERWKAAAKKTGFKLDVSGGRLPMIAQPQVQFKAPSQK